MPVHLSPSYLPGRGSHGRCAPVSKCRRHSSCGGRGLTPTLTSNPVCTVRRIPVRRGTGSSQLRCSQELLLLVCRRRLACATANGHVDVKRSNILRGAATQLYPLRLSLAEHARRVFDRFIKDQASISKYICIKNVRGCVSHMGARLGGWTAQRARERSSCNGMWVGALAGRSCTCMPNCAVISASRLRLPVLHADAATTDAVQMVLGRARGQTHKARR